MGMPKVLVADGEWLRRAVSALSVGGCAEILVMLGAAVVEPPEPARPITVVAWSTGLAATVRAGLVAAEQLAVDMAVFTTVDTPDIPADAVRRTLHAAGESGVARASYAGRPGHPVVLSRPHWHAALQTLAGDVGLAPYLATVDVRIVDCTDLATGADHDTPLG